MKYFIYIVECIDKSFYTGYTNDIEKRIKKHNSGNGAKYTKTRLPVKLIYMEEFNDKSSALKREYEIKQLSRKQKEKLIRPWPTLAGRLSHPLTSRKEALIQSKRNGMTLSKSAQKELEKYEN